MTRSSPPPALLSGLALALFGGLACGENAPSPPPPPTPVEMPKPPPRLGRLVFSRPVPIDGLFMSRDGTLFGAEGFMGTRVFRIGGDGSVTVYADGLRGPIDIAEGPNGDLFVTNFNGGNVSRISPDGRVSNFARVSEAPAGIVADETGVLYVAHYGPPTGPNRFGAGDSIARIAPTGEVTTLSQGGDLLAPVGLDLGPDGTLYTSNFHNGKVIAIDTDTGAQTLLAQVLSAPQGLGVGHLAVGGDQVYVTLYTQGRVRRIDPATGENTLLEAQLNNPNGIAFRGTPPALWIAEAGEIQNLSRVDLN